MRVGIAGAGTIVPDFLTAAKMIDSINVAAICGVKNDAPAMEKLSKEYNIAEMYFDYDEMLLNEEIDTVYVAVPNVLHYPFTKKALLQGKNVIVEKPFVVKKSEAEELMNLACEKHLYLFEAMPNLYYPNYKKMKELVSQLGDIKIVQLNYSQYSRRYDQFKEGVVLPVFDPSKAGGALLDLNVYNAHFVIGMFGMPDHIEYYANIEREIDTSGILLMKYKTMQCVCVAAKDCKAPVTINVQGDKGYIHSGSPANVIEHFECGDNFGEKKTYALNEKGWSERMYHELTAFAKMIEEDDFEQMIKNLRHSVNVVDLLERARASAGMSF